MGDIGGRFKKIGEEKQMLYIFKAQHLAKMTPFLVILASIKPKSQINQARNLVMLKTF